VKKSKIYINCPGAVLAGGVESLFQLADAINSLGGDAIMLWDQNHSNPIPKKYSHYNIKHSEPVIDSPENWVIYPEVWTEKIDTFKNMRKCIWWLSVTNNHGKFKNFSNSKVTHFYQSFFALEFLQKNNVDTYLPLFDYINKNYTEQTYDSTLKEDIVCFNPVKGKEITSSIIKNTPNVKFVPITNMSEEKVIELLKISKIYIDFGHHPGRDRIPRESVILGNCILTNKSGAAGFYNDIPIDKKYKVENIEEVSSMINFCLENYTDIVDDFSIYRSSVKNQKEQLYNLCKQTFNL
jgi:hypothetical protein